MKPRKHSELIKAWADGAEIQVKRTRDGVWVSFEPNESPSWRDDYEYRIKQEPKPDVVRFVIYEWNPINEKTYGGIPDQIRSSFSNLKIIFDGETGKLKSADVL